jgi:pSer/pThr/pTyr-binding forkhead associated (FHA) protein
MGSETRKPGDLARIQEVERARASFVVYRDDQDEQRVLVLETGVPALIGRRETCQVALPWDDRVSRVHAELVPVGGQWAVVDDGSTNGTFVNGERVMRRRRLSDRDVVRVGHTQILFRQPTPGETGSTMMEDWPKVAPVTEAQRRVLVALCRPCLTDRLAPPATNAQIAAELHLTVEAVKQHLRALGAKFAVAGLPQNQKRTRLVRLAIEGGVVTPADAEP